MAYSISSEDLAKSVSDAVRKLRKELGESQQQFAYRMKTAIRTVARYETVRPPKGKVLRQLEVMATENNLRYLAEVFRGALNQELGVRPSEALDAPGSAILGSDGGIGKPDGSSLPRVMKRIASDLMRRFPLMIAQDPKRFKKQAVYHLKRHLPPGPGRPLEDAITKAIELRTQGYLWKHIYPLCIANHSALTPAECRMAQDNLRAACRSRRNAAKRRKRRGALISEGTPA